MDNEKYIKIQAYLDNQGISIRDEYGLYEGQMGLSYCYLLLSQYYRSKENYKTGISLLENVKSKLVEIDDIGLSKGLLGIGLGVNSLYLNKLININIDEFLYDFDDLFYKLITLKKANSFSLENGILGKALYFYNRNLTQNRTQQEYRYLLHKECLILLTSEFKSFLLSN